MADQPHVAHGFDDGSVEKGLPASVYPYQNANRSAYRPRAGAATELKGLISYEEGSIANLDLAHTDNMKFVLMAFDEGTGLTPHRAPGNAILTALEGKAIIGYEGQDYELTAGQSFRFDKNGLHSVTAQGKFKMSLLLVLE